MPIEQAQQLKYTQPQVEIPMVEQQVFPLQTASRPLGRILRETLHDRTALLASAGSIPVALGIKAFCYYLISIPNMEIYAMRGTFVGVAALAITTMAINATE